MVDAALLKRWALPLAAAIGALILVAMAFIGTRENTSLAEFKAAGLMVGIPTDRIAQVEVRSTAKIRTFRRASDGWSEGEANNPVALAEKAAIDEGLKLLHNAAPEREFSEAESAALAEFGLAPPVLRVSVSGEGIRFSVDFGAPNPMGLSRYARVGESKTAVLMPSYLVEPWLRVMGIR